MVYTGHISSTSNREDWQEIVIVTDEETGQLIDLSLCRITMSVTMGRRNPNDTTIGRYGYGPAVYGYSDMVLLTGSTDTGEITVIDLGTFQWLFPEGRMASMPPGEYQVGIRVMQNGSTMQLVIGTAIVQEGLDTQ